MLFYDKDKYDGYFYRNGYLVVLYGVEQSDGILDDTWIKKENSVYPILDIRQLKTGIIHIR